MTTRRTRRTAALAVPVLLAGAVLSGCGVSDARIRPGLAADVDGTSIPLSKVDDATDAVCAYAATPAAGAGTAIPRALQRRAIANTYITKAALEHLVRERGLTLSSNYTSDLADIDNQLVGVDDPQGALRDVSRANAYVTAAELAVGDSEYAKTGDIAGNLDLSVARGRSVAFAWMQQHRIDLNPVLGLEIGKDGPVAAEGGLSVPVSEDAKAGVVNLDDPDVQKKVAQLVATLPADQVCGAKPS